MPDPGTALGAGSAVLGYSSSRKASKSASASSAASLAFEQQKYDDWQETYGGIEDNLAEYYSTLTPDYFEAQGLEAFQKEHQASTQRVQELLAQRGIQDSGIALASEVSGELSAATSRATIRAQAPALVAEEQRNFLQVGLGQNPGASYSRALSEKAGRDEASARVAEASAGRSISSAITTVGTALSGSAGSSPNVDPGRASANYTTDYSGYA